MQNIIIEKQYRFVPPRQSRFWPAIVQRWLPRYLRDNHGIEAVSWRGLDRLRASLKAGHGILLTPNHCRPCDPMVLYPLRLAVGAPLPVLASWDFFMEG